MFSAEGIRWDVLAIALTLVLALFITVLAADVDALFAHGGRIGELNAGIASLETNNSSLREALSGYVRFPVLTLVACCVWFVHAGE